jgi:hypothetical protein
MFYSFAGVLRHVFIDIIHTLLRVLYRKYYVEIGERIKFPMHCS